MTFGQRLSELRREKKFTQKVFAQELNVSERCVRAYENGTRHPDFVANVKLLIDDLLAR